MSKDYTGRLWLPILFYAVFCASALLLLVPAAKEAMQPQGQFSGVAVLFGLVITALLAAIAAAVAIIGKPLAYWVGLAVMLVPLLIWVSVSLGNAG